MSDFIVDDPTAFNAYMMQLAGIAYGGVGTHH
jgi:hypothetical protein